MITISYLMMAAGFGLLYWYLRREGRTTREAMRTTAFWAAVYCMSLGLFILANPVG